MKNLIDIKNEETAKHTELFKECGLFWAFSTEQFNEGKTELQEGEKYVSIGAGGYLPKHNLAKLRQGLKDIAKWRKGEIQANKLQYKQIAYELSNHECYYTGDISTVIGIFEGIYSAEQIRKVFNKERVNHLND